MVYAVQWAPAAARQFRKLDRDVRERLRPAIDALAADPRPPGCEKLSGYPDLWRIRCGDFRIVYRVADRELVVLVAAVANRRDIYEELKRLNL